jgi:penicillin-binding protein 1A
MARSRNGFFARHPRLVRGVLLTMVFFVALAGGGAFTAWALVCRGGACPSVAVLDDYTPRQTSKVFASDGRFLAEIGLERRTLIKLEQLPPVVQQAFLTVEDKRFYSHRGIDWIRVPGSMLQNLRAGRVTQGFSTITMQLSGNIFPERINRRDRSGVAGLTRKLREAKVAREIEAKYPKQKILELYLNQIYLGNGAYGVETASQRYFGKSATELNLAEAATLAALPKGPTRYDPRRYADRAIQRRNTIIELMRRDGKVSDADANLAKAYPLRLAQKEESGQLAPYFVEWVRQQLDQQFGKSLYEQGLKVYTTIDVELQSAAERAMERQLRAIEDGRYGKFPHQSYERYVASRDIDPDVESANSPYLQGAFVAVEPRTGAVRALVGGRDFDDSKFNRATQALRQPGSTFKPIVYAAAVQNGRPVTTTLEDAPIAVPQANGSQWTPQNYDLKFEGPTPMRRALYLSRNIPAIRMGMELGEQTVIDMAKRFGISTPIPAYPSIHIGSADVYPLEMIASFSTFATLGQRAAPYGITRVENARGEVLWEPQPVRASVLSPEEAWLMVDMMKDVVRRGTAYRSVWASGFQIPSGGKTGTTNDGADVWYIGYTSDLVAGVWIGFDRPKKIKSNAQGGELAAPAWTAFMTEAYRRRQAPGDWPRPDGLVQREVDASTGMPPNPWCPQESIRLEWFIPGTEPMGQCTVHEPFGTPADSANPFAIPGAQPIPGQPGTVLGPSGTPTPGQPSTTRVTPGSAPVPQASRTPVRRDTGRVTRDTTNPFRIP